MYGHVAGIHYLKFPYILVFPCETRVLKEAIKQKLLVFERKILRRIFGWYVENQNK
jgi:hypothetical protein